MVEKSYVECTASVMRGLKEFTLAHPEYKNQQIKKCLSNAQRYILSQQRPDGSWYGSWGVCFTYATLFAVDALASMGQVYSNWYFLQITLFIDIPFF